MSRQFQMDDYIDVAARIAEFRAKYPEGSLQQVALDFREVAGSWWVIYTAGAYRSADDARPGHGTAWEPVPGKTPYTRDSELQNCETAAWGRAIVAALAADTKKGIASAEEVRNAQERRAAPAIAPPTAASLLAHAQAAATTDALNVIAHQAVSAQGAGHITADELDSVKEVVVARRLELTTGGAQ